MVQRHHGCDALCNESVNQPVVVVNAGLVAGGSCPVRHDAAPGDGEPVEIHLQVHTGISHWAQSGTDWPQIGQIPDFFRSDFGTFGSSSQMY